MQKLTDLPDINPSDTVYSEGDRYVKVRVLEVEIDPVKEAQAARNCIVLEVSASVCDANGKALSDDALGYLIAPASRHTLQIQGLVDKAIKEQLEPSDVIDSVVDGLRQQHAVEALAWQQVHAFRVAFVKYPTPVIPADPEAPANE